MIINRYIQRNVFMGTVGALLLLVGLGLFFIFVGELERMREGVYGLPQILQYLALKTPEKIVEFLPLSALLGCMLSLGALASNSEIIAMQASGITLRRMLFALFQAALAIALAGFLLAEYVVPDSDILARKIRNRDSQQSTTLDLKRGLWIKDETRIVRVQELLPNGYANGIEIYQLDGEGRLLSLTRARSARPRKGGWELHEVLQTTLGDGQSQVQQLDRLVYQGNLSHQLLQVLLISPWQMSGRDLYAYLNFLDENRLDARSEKLIFWQKMFSPLTVIIMCLLAFPFALGSQRQSNAGTRLLIGILLGLSFVAISRVVTQIGTQVGVNAMLSVLATNLLFLGFAFFLIFRRRIGGKRLRPLAGFMQR
jgi:lipopolysaccharide export system permease protein